jgi:SNF2 family DNA or RNA helicase
MNNNKSNKGNKSNKPKGPHKLLKQVTKQFKKAGFPLKPHQLEGIRWMLTQEQRRVGGILADDPGLGKTFQAVALALTTPRKKGQTLFVVPTSTLSQWQRAITDILGPGSVHVHHGSSRPRFIPWTRTVLTTYGIIKSEPEMRRYKWARVILDEAHLIKSRRSKVSKAAMELQSPFRWGLTGTPVQNRHDETANLFRFVLGRSDAEFDLERMMRTHLLRRRKETVLGDKIPNLTVTNTEIPFSSNGERNFYLKIQRNVKQEFRELADTHLSVGEEMAAMFELLLRLRQTAQHPQIVIDGLQRKHKRRMRPWTGTCSKHEALLKLLQSHPDEGSLVFCQFRQEMDILQELLQGQGHRVLRLDGSMSALERAQVLDSVQKGAGNADPNPKNICKSHAALGEGLVQEKVGQYLDAKPPVFLIQINAGGVGLNLQAFSRVYITSPDWNPCNEIQAIARAHRLGQDRPVKVTKLVLKGVEDDPQAKNNFSVVDARILEIQKSKRNLMADLLQEEQLRDNGRITTHRKGGRGLSRRDYRKLLC